jgi:cytochrome c-type biogenesis protein CcmH
MMRTFYPLRRTLYTLFLALLLGSTLASAANAQQPTPSDDEVNAIARQLYCPVCENVPLDVCPTQACAQWRDLIRQKLIDGWTEQQIKDYFVEQYGARVLAAPPAQGFNWLVYLVPPVAILAGIYILWRAMRSWKQPASRPIADEPATETPEDKYVRRLEEELRKR